MVMVPTAPEVDVDTIMPRSVRRGTSLSRGWVAGVISGPGTKDGRPLGRLSDGPVENQGVTQDSKNKELTQRIEYAFFTGPLSFLVVLGDAKNQDDLKVLMRFEDFSWKITRVFLPIDKMIASTDPLGVESPGDGSPSLDPNDPRSRKADRIPSPY